MKISILLALPLLLAGCFSPPRGAVLRGSISLLGSDDRGEREKAFRELSRGGAEVLGLLKQAQPVGAKHGLPVVALLYALGEGDAVRMDLKARHVAAFRWPKAPEHALLEPYVWNEIERDLTAAGTPALPLLARVLDRHATAEDKALQVVRVMLRIGGREAARAFAGLLGSTRDLGGVRVCEIAAGALLFEGRQELLLRAADRAELVRTAREWWGRSSSAPEADWTREALAALAARWTPEDEQGIRPAFELLAGETVDDPKAWMTKPVVAPSAAQPEELVSQLSGPRPVAFAANARLERASGVRLYVPPMATLGELCSALRLWQAPSGLALRWKRHFQGPMLRLSIVVVGHHPDRGRNHVLFVREEFFHASENVVGELEFANSGGSYFLFVEARAQGTRLVYSEYAALKDGNRGFTREHSAIRPVAEFSSLLEACIVVSVDEVQGRIPSRGQDVFYAEAQSKLRRWAAESEGEERRRALRALGYLQHSGDRELFVKHDAGASLLLLGDPAGLAHEPELTSYEIEMALRQAKDPRVREWLEGAKPPEEKPLAPRPRTGRRR